MNDQQAKSLALYLIAGLIVLCEILFVVILAHFGLRQTAVNYIAPAVGVALLVGLALRTSRSGARN